MNLTTNTSIESPHPIICYQDDYDMWNHFSRELVHSMPLKDVAWSSKWKTGCTFNVGTMPVAWKPNTELVSELEKHYTPSSKKLTAAQSRAEVFSTAGLPFCQVYIVHCEDLDTYKQLIKSRLKDWLNKVNSLAARGKGGGEWLILYVSLEDRKTKLDLAQKLFGKIYDRLRSDFNPKNKDRCCQLKLYTEAEGRLGGDQWSEFLSLLKGCIVSSFEARLSYFEEEVRNSMSSRFQDGWSIADFAAVKESQASLFHTMGLFSHSLLEYDELEAVLVEKGVSDIGWDLYGQTDVEDAERSLIDLSKGEVADTCRTRIIVDEWTFWGFWNYLFSRQAQLLLNLGTPAEMAARGRNHLMLCTKMLKNAFTFGEDNTTDSGSSSSSTTAIPRPGFIDEWVFIAALDIVQSTGSTSTTGAHYWDELKKLRALQAELLCTARNRFRKLAVLKGYDRDSLPDLLNDVCFSVYGRDGEGENEDDSMKKLQFQRFEEAVRKIHDVLSVEEEKRKNRGSGAFVPPPLPPHFSGREKDTSEPQSNSTSDAPSHSPSASASASGAGRSDSATGSGSGSGSSRSRRAKHRRIVSRLNTALESSVTMESMFLELTTRASVHLQQSGRSRDASRLNAEAAMLHLMHGRASLAESALSVFADMCKKDGWVELEVSMLRLAAICMQHVKNHVGYLSACARLALHGNSRYATIFIDSISMLHKPHTLDIGNAEKMISFDVGRFSAKAKASSSLPPSTHTVHQGQGVDITFYVENHLNIDLEGVMCFEILRSTSPRVGTNGRTSAAATALRGMLAGVGASEIQTQNQGMESSHTSKSKPRSSSASASTTVTANQKITPTPGSPSISTTAATTNSVTCTPRPVVLKPGCNELTLHVDTFATGDYRIQYFTLVMGNLTLRTRPPFPPIPSLRIQVLPYEVPMDLSINVPHILVPNGESESDESESGHGHVQCIHIHLNRRYEPQLDVDVDVVESESLPQGSKLVVWCDSSELELDLESDKGIDDIDIGERGAIDVSGLSDNKSIKCGVKMKVAKAKGFENASMVVNAALVIPALNVSFKRSVTLNFVSPISIEMHSEKDMRVQVQPSESESESDVGGVCALCTQVLVSLVTQTTLEIVDCSVKGCKVEGLDGVVLHSGETQAAGIAFLTLSSNDGGGESCAVIRYKILDKLLNSTAIFTYEVPYTSPEVSSGLSITTIVAESGAVGCSIPYKAVVSVSVPIDGRGEDEDERYSYSVDRTDSWMIIGRSRGTLEFGTRESVEISLHVIPTRVGLLSTPTITLHPSNGAPMKSRPNRFVATPRASLDALLYRGKSDTIRRQLFY